MKRLLCIVLVAGSFLTGCRSFKPDVVQEDIFTLSAPNLVSAENAPRILKTVVVEPPIPAPGLDSEKIVLHRGNKLDFYANTRWAERLPIMLQAFLVESLENTGRLKAVANDLSTVSADYALLLESRDFQAVYDSEEGSPTIQAQWTAKLLSLPDRSVIASIPVKAQQPATENRMQPIAEAFDTAADEAAKQLVEQLFPILEADIARLNSLPKTQK